VVENILFFFSALGVFNALLLGMYMLFAKPYRQVPDYILGALLLLLVLRVGVSCFHYFGAVPKGAIKLGLSANLLLGPVIWLLMKALILPNKKIVAHSLWHLGFWLPALFLTWFLFDWPTWNFKIRFVIHLILTAYLVAAAITWRKPIKLFMTTKKTASNTRQAIMTYLSLLVICSGFAISLFSSYIIGPLVFSLVIYIAIAYFLFKSKKVKKQPPHKKINGHEYSKLNVRLIQLMEVEKRYKDPDLKLESLANELSISRHLLSQLLNDNLQKNFHQYINDYRIDEACRILKENKHFSIEAIGHEVGFHSRSSFFAAFKKKTGITPSKYRNDA